MDTWKFESSLADMTNKKNRINVDKSREVLQNVSKAVAVGLAAVTIIEFLQDRRKN